MNDFFPQGYESPVEGSYMKFEQGDNTFRVLSSAIVGYEFWKTTTNEDGKDVRKPVRRHMNEVIQPDELEENEIPKHFWAFVVFNRNAKKVQILEITQKRVQASIKALVTNSKWGDPKDYDITVSKDGKGLETNYSVMPEPKELLSVDVIKQYESLTINLEALFTNDDPFKTNIADKVADEFSKFSDPENHSQAEIIHMNEADKVLDF